MCAKRLHTNRALGSDCHNRVADVDIDAGSVASERASQDGRVHREPQAMGADMCNVHAGERREVLGR